MMVSFIIATMMIPAQISLIGYTVEMRNLGLTNSLLPLILTWGASAYGVFFMLQYMKTSIAIELIESARIDGCGELRTFFSIALPLIKAASGTFFMLIFLWSWNNFLMPSTLINNREKFTIPIGIQTLATAYTRTWRGLDNICSATANIFRYRIKILHKRVGSRSCQRITLRGLI
jgi:multiple sugar transport system permease protein/cellobiose transport system permease protein